MPSITPQILSGSANGRNIKVAATATPGTAVHTAVNVAGAYDDIWLEAYNSDTVTRTLTIELGGTTAPDDTIKVPIPPQSGAFAVVAGRRLSGGVLVKAFADAANVVTIGGQVSRYNP